MKTNRQSRTLRCPGRGDPAAGNGQLSTPTTPPLSLWADAWRELRRRPLFIISAVMIALIIVVAVFPGLFTQVAPDNGCVLANSNGAPPKATRWASRSRAATSTRALSTAPRPR